MFPARTEASLTNGATCDYHADFGRLSRRWGSLPRVGNRRIPDQADWPIGTAAGVVQVLGAKHTEVVETSLVTRHSIREQKPGLHILLAEDNRVNQAVVRGVLGKRGHRAEIANDGRYWKKSKGRTSIWF